MDIWSLIPSAETSAQAFGLNLRNTTRRPVMTRHQRTGCIHRYRARYTIESAIGPQEGSSARLQVLVVMFLDG